MEKIPQAIVFINMKKLLITETQLKKLVNYTLNEGDNKYLDFLLDKVSKNGINSLNSLEKDDLYRLSNDENFTETHILRLTAAKGNSVIPRNRKYTMTGSAKYGAMKSILVGKAEELAGTEIPIFFEGNLAMLDKPVKEQRIKLFLPSGEYDCITILDEDERVGIFYLIFLRDEYLELTHRTSFED